MQSFITFISHFHPVLVHLPIGMLLAALLLQALSTRKKYTGLRPAVPVVLLAGLISAVLSCMTGYLLSLSGDYDDSLVSWHMWMGISLTILSAVLYFWILRRGVDRVYIILSLLLLVLIVVTGHLGGSLTHGPDYLTGPFTGGGGGAQAGLAGLAVDTPIANVQEARAYEEIIRPILQNDCYGCHGSGRQKGGLRVDGPAALLKGGKDGIVLVPGKGDASELIKRLMLPLEEEHHMPPKEKKQLNERQLALVHWWIDQGADFTHKVKELKQPDSIRPALLSLQGRRSRPAASDLPSGPAPAADPAAIAALAAKGVLVMPVAQNSNWLEAEFEGQTPPGPGGGSMAAKPGSLDSLVSLLLPLHKQLVSLQLGNAGIGDSALAVVGRCEELRSLDLTNTRISDKGLGALGSLHELRVLTLVGTSVTADGVAADLRSLSKLRSLYLYRTHVTARDWSLLKKVFPAVLLDSGGYSIPVLAGDTEVVKALVAAGAKK
jgi:uncharacterized membrane protein